MSTSPDYERAREAWVRNHLAPLWESAVAHRPGGDLEVPRLWKWSDVRACLEDAIRHVSPGDVERRVLTLRNPRPNRPHVETTTPGLNAAFQVLLPGEIARPHRHSIDALRFVVEGTGAVTRVDGKDCPMQPGDLVLTPGGTWHEHHHDGSEAVIWLDVLNGPLHRFLGTATFEPGPTNDLPASLPDAAFSAAGLVPENVPGLYSPLFRYPYDRASEALAQAPATASGEQRLRYINPLTGDSALALMSACLVGLRPQGESAVRHTNASTICHVVEGTGHTQIDDGVIAWSAKDVFTVPAGCRSRHIAGEASSRIFEVSDRPVLARLGLLQDGD